MTQGMSLHLILGERTRWRKKEVRTTRGLSRPRGACGLEWECAEGGEEVLVGFAGEGEG